jgi:hypothetical protein
METLNTPQSNQKASMSMQGEMCNKKISHVQKSIALLAVRHVD